MDKGPAGSPVSDTIALLAQPAALLAGLALAGAHLSRSFIMSAMLDWFRQGGGYGLFGVVSMGAGIFMFAAFAIVQFVLSRKLGGPEDSEKEPGTGNWIILMILYFLVNQLTSFMAPIFLRSGGFDSASLPLFLGGTSLIIRLVFFPVMVFLAAMAHDGNGCRFADIWSFLTGRGIGWLIGYVLLALIVTFIPMGLITALGPRAGSAMGGGMLVSSLVLGAGQLLAILYAIAAYRAVRANGDGDGQMFG